MTLSIEEVARAFSGHEFAKTYPYLRDDIRWDVVGADIVLEKRQVVSSCEYLRKELDGVSVDTQRMRVVVGGSTVVVDAVTRYEGDDPATVSSCDIYEFDDDGLVTQITSYNVELSA